MWLFDFHHYLFSGEAGAITGGVLGLIGIGFVVTGIVLWWPQRKTFRLRLWPARMTRPAIVRQHRDLGIVIAPLLFLSLLTGVTLALKPVRELVFSPLAGPAEMRAALAPPEAVGGAMPDRIDWAALLGEARRRFPDGEFRVLGLPRRPGGLISLRMKQPAEWLPNGRTTLWFDPADGRVIEARDALAFAPGPKLFNMVYPVHAARVGGLPYRLAMTLSGLALALLGTLSVWTFWFRRPKARRSGRH